MTTSDSATVTLIGGGWTASAAAEIYGPFLRAAAGDRPRIACVVLDEGDGMEQFARWESVLLAVGSCLPIPVLVPIGTWLDMTALKGADAVLVCGGLTPAYADALVPVAGDLRRWCAEGRPYAGFSAGAAIAATSALIGGYRMDGRVVCPPDAAEDLDDVTVVAGLGLVPASVDVHASSWGTLGRALAAARGGLADTVFAIDEDTALVVDNAGRRRVAGLGAVHFVRASEGVTTVSTLLPNVGMQDTTDIVQTHAARAHPIGKPQGS